MLSPRRVASPIAGGVEGAGVEGPAASPPSASALSEPEPTGLPPSSSGPADSPAVGGAASSPVGVESGCLLPSGSAVGGSNSETSPSSSSASPASAESSSESLPQSGSSGVDGAAPSCGVVGTAVEYSLPEDAGDLAEAKSIYELST